MGLIVTMPLSLARPRLYPGVQVPFRQMADHLANCDFRIAGSLAREEMDVEA